MKKLLTRIKSFRKTDLFQTSFWNGIATIIKMGTSLVSNKIVAVYLGPSGIAMLGQFGNFTSMASSFASMGIGTGVTKYIAEYKGEEEEKRKILSTGIKTLLAATFIVSIVVLLGAEYFDTTILGTNKYNVLFYIFSVTLFLFTLNGFFISVLNGYKEFKKIILINVLSSIIGLVIAIVLVIKFGLWGALVGTILSTTLIAFITFTFVAKSHWFNRMNFLAKFDYSAFRNLSKYTLMAFTSIFAVTYIQLAIRTYIINHLSIEEAGYWQGIVKISDIYLSVITTTLGIYYLPRLSEIKDNLELRKEIFKGYKFLMPITILSSLAVYLLRDFIINVLFTPSFQPMKQLFLFQFLGDIFKIASWLLGYIAIAKAMFKTFIVLEIFGGSLFYLLAILFVSQIGVKGATIAYCITYVIYFITLLIVFRSKLII